MGGGAYTVKMYSCSVSSLPNSEARLFGRASIDPCTLELPLAAVRAKLGFPSPAEDFQDGAIDLNRYLVRNPAATFLYRAHGNSMLDAGIVSGDVLVVDRSEQPQDGDIVLAQWEGNAPVCKVLRLRSAHMELHSCNSQVPPIIIKGECEVEVFAVVAVARQVRREHASR